MTGARCRARARSHASWIGLQPEPPLFPSDPERRAAVEEAERFGDEELQHPIRQISWWAIKRDNSSLRSYSEGAKLGIPIGLAVRTAAPIVALAARFNEATDENVRRDLAALPASSTRSTPGSRPASWVANSSTRRLPDRPEHRPGDDAR